jgi:hypothetical protein
LVLANRPRKLSAKAVLGSIQVNTFGNQEPLSNAKYYVVGCSIKALGFRVAAAWATRFNRSMLCMCRFGSECSRQLILQASHDSIPVTWWLEIRQQYRKSDKEAHGHAGDFDLLVTLETSTRQNLWQSQVAMLCC